MGRIAICEILTVDRTIEQLALRKASASEIRDQAIARGMTTLAQDGWERVLQGVTTADEVLRVAYVNA